MFGMTKRIGKAFFRVLGHYPASIHGLKFKLDPDHIGLWRAAAQGHWEPSTYAILSKFLKADSVYCDVGAWVGPTVVYAAKICRQVICFEPDPVACRYLRWNVELNDLDNVTSYNVALAERFGVRRMASFGGHLGDSMTSLLDENHAQKGFAALALSWGQFIDISGVERIDFIKIDIEGGEFELLPALRGYLSRYKPILYLSTHAPFFESSLRRTKMQQIVDVMGMYRKCLNEDLEEMDVRQLSSPEHQDQFGSFLFME